MCKTNVCLSLMLGLLFQLPLNAVAAETAADVLQETKTLYQKAVELQGAWISTEQLIKKTTEAMQKGDNATALRLAQQARQEAKLSIEQAQEQQKNWREPDYIRH